MRSVVQHPTRPVWAEIAVAHLTDNYRAVRQAAGEEIEVLAVIKADAYGHGARQCAPVLAAAGARWLGVTSVEEGIAVRGALGILPQGMVPRILVMCGLWPGEESLCMDYGLTPVVWEMYQLELLEQEGMRCGRAARTVPVHLEIDTGMARQGVTPGMRLQDLLERFRPASPLLLQGILTHLASSESAGSPQNADQMARFGDALEQVRNAGLCPEIIHVGNTSATDSGLVAAALPALAYRLRARPLTRAGLALYGYTLPLEGAQPRLEPRLESVLTWKTRVISLRDIQGGTTVGYNAAFIAPHAMRLALLPFGYADGLRRALSSSNGQTGGTVLLHGKRAPIVGRVSMDLTMVDVTAMPSVEIGDEAVLLGAQGAEHIGADEHARLAGTSVYEILCGISERVPRVVTGAT